MTPLEAEFIAIAKEILGEFGWSGVIRRTSLSTFDASTLTATEGNTVQTCLGAFFDPANSKLTGYEQTLEASTKRGKWMYIQTDGQFDDGDTVEYGTRKFKAVGMTKLGTTDQVIFYKVMTQEIQ